MVQLASAVWRQASLFPQRASNNSMVCTLWRFCSTQGRTERFRRKNDCCSQAIIGTEAKELYGTSFQSISTSFVLSRDRGSVEAMSTASDISIIGTDCKVQNHLLRPCKQTQPQAQTARTQRSPHRRVG